MTLAELQSHLETRLALPGVAAWCVCSADGAYHEHVVTDWFKTEQIQALVSQLAETVEGLHSRKIEPQRVCCIFEHARIFLAQRGDGVVLALFVENRPSLNPAEIHRALDEFADLELA